MEIFNRFLSVVVDPVVRLLFAAAILYFIYGVFRYFAAADSSEARTVGANHILWSLIGILIMVSIWGIIRFVGSSIGVAL